MAEETSTQNTSKSGEQVAPTTLKLLQNKTHIGPVSSGRAAKASLSKAAGKIIFDSNLKVTVNETGAEAGKISDPTRKPVVQKINLLRGREPHQATLYMLAWAKLYPETGSKQYQEKYEAFARAQGATYKQLGFDLGPNDPKPMLTEQARRMYNDKMQPFAFSYYEYRLSFKKPGCKAVRSLTYRTLRPMDIERTVSRLTEQVQKLSKDLTVEIRK